MSKSRAGEVWKEIKPFAIRDLLHGSNKSNSSGDEYSIILYKAGSGQIKKFSVTTAGLQAALAGAGNGDVVWLPACIITGDQTVPAGVALVGLSSQKTKLTGQIILASGACLQSLMVKRSEISASAIYGVIDGGGIAYIYNCTIDVANAGAGGAYAIYLASAGVFYVYDSELLALTGTDGYAVYITDGALYQMGGRAKGTITLMPYYY